jgi:hypothetical protein
MKAITILCVTLAGLLLTGCGSSTSTNPTTATNAVDTNSAATNFASGNPITAVPDYIGAVGNAQKYAVKQIDLSYLHQAIEQFNVSEGRYPKNLQEMVPNYIGKVPDAPYGSKLVYDPNSGTVKVVPR